MSGEVEYRLIIERNLGPTESRVMREERSLRHRDDALRLSGYWEAHSGRNGMRGWIEQREVGLWENFPKR